MPFPDAVAIEYKDIRIPFLEVNTREQWRNFLSIWIMALMFSFMTQTTGIRLGVEHDQKIDVFYKIGLFADLNPGMEQRL